MSGATGRVGIVTIVDNDNFGNRLQNFALQEALVSRGWQVETIGNSPSPMRRSLLAARALSAIRSDGVVPFARRNGRLLVDRLRPSPESATGPPPVAPERREAITAFTQRHIQELKTDFTHWESDALADRYDHVVVGSDQVWNPGFRQANEIDFLTFARPEQRVAYAASFGVSEVPSYLRRSYARWLADIPHISVREERGAQIVSDLIGRSVPVVADPTMLVDPSMWHERAHPPGHLQGRRYLATFFLGGLPTPEAVAIAEAARAEELEVIDLLHPRDPQLLAMSPLEFVGAIRAATLLATDSFHASVFSLIFERPTITRPRHLDDTRLATLFDHAGVGRRSWPGSDMMRTGDVDWGLVARRLADLRAASWGHLDTAVGSFDNQEDQ